MEAFGSKRMVLLCIVIQLVKMLVTTLTSLTCGFYQDRQGSYSALWFGVNPESVKGEIKSKNPLRSTTGQSSRKKHEG